MAKYVSKKEIIAQVKELKAQYEKETDIRKRWGIIQLIFNLLVTAGIVTAWIFKPSKEKMKEIAWKAIYEYDMAKTPEIREYLTLPQLQFYPTQKAKYDEALQKLTKVDATDDEKKEARKAMQEALKNPEYKEEQDKDDKKSKGKKKAEEKAEEKK